MKGNNLLNSVLTALRSAPEEKERRFLFYLALSASWLLAIVGLSAVVYGIPRGFDWSDEAFYWMAYQQPEDFVYVGFFQWFGKVFLIDGLPEIQTLRTIRLLLHLISAGFLFYSIKAFFSKSESPNPTLPFVLPLLLIANWASYSLGPQSLSYNHLVLIILQIQTGIVLRMNQPDSNRLNDKIGLFALGLSNPVLLLAKFPTAVVFTFFWPVFIWLIQEKPSWKKPLFSFLSLSISLLLLTGTPERFHQFIQEYQAFGATMKSHEPLHLLTKLKGDAIHFFEDLVQDSLYFDRLLLFALLIYFSFFRSRIALLLLALWIFPTISNYLNFLDNQYVFPAQSAWIYLIAGGIIIQTFRSTKAAAIVLAYALIPFGASLGTNNNLFTQITFYFPFFILATLWLKSRMARNFGFVSIVLAVGAIGFSFYLEFWKNPYRLKAPITQQNIPYQIKDKEEKLLLDAETANALHELDILLTLNNINPENHFLCAYSGMMGAGLLLGYQPPVRSWNDNKEQEYNRYCWNNSKLRKDKPFVWLSADSTELMPRFLVTENLQSKRIGEVELVVYQKKQKVFVSAVEW